jgi:uncharacterized membrane protein
MKKGGILCALLLITVVVDLVIRAWLRPFWFDELFTVHLSRLNLATLWNALSTGADANPPLSYVITGLFQRWLGESELATRLPSVIAFVVALAFLYKYVASRLGCALGLSAGLLFCLTGAYGYGSEARPYAMVLACCAVALWSWSRVERSRLHVLCFALSLTLAIACHYYAVLLLIPFGVGELVRAAQRRRMDWPVWGALAFSAVSVVLYLPLLRSLAGQRAGFWSVLTWSSVREFFSVGFGESWELVLAASVVCVLSWWREPSKPVPATSACPLCDWVALVILALLPVPALVLGAMCTNAFVPRYVLPCLLGFSALLPSVLEACFGRTSGWRFLLLLVLVLGFVGIRLAGSVRELSRHVPGRTTMVEVLLRDGGRTELDARRSPIVVTAPLLYPVFVHYSKPELRERLVYLADPAAAFRFRQVNTPDLALLKIAPWTGFHVESYASFVSRNDEFLLVVAPGDRFGWLMNQLQQDDKSTVFVASRDGYQLLWLHR